MVRRAVRLRSPLAHHKSVGGYSMVELLLTVVFVALGTQLIQGSFLRAAEVLGRYSDTLKVMVWADEQTARTREELLDGEPEYSQSGTLQYPNKDFAWNQTVQSLSGPNLYGINLSVEWAESGRPQKLLKEIYVYKRDLSQRV